MLVEVGIGLDGRTPADLWRNTSLILPSFTTTLISNAHFAPHIEIVERIAIEHLADLSALERELAIDIHQSSQEFQLDACLAHCIVRIRQSALEHTADTGIEQFEVMFKESEIDMQLEYSIEICVHLTFCIPAVVTRSSAQMAILILDIGTECTLQVAQ